MLDNRETGVHIARGLQKGKTRQVELPGSLEFDPTPRIRDLQHCWKTNAMRSGLHQLIADAIVGHGDRKKDVKSVYLTISDADLLREIDKLTFDHGKTEIGGSK